MSKRDFYAVVSEAIKDFTRHGFDSQERLERWLVALEAAADSVFLPRQVVQQKIREQLVRIFDKLVNRPAVLLKRHPGVSVFTLRQIAPKLRSELDRRILASANLITLDKKAAKQRALQRFAGWATSIPIGGSRAVDKAEEGEKIRRSMAGLSYVERRCVTDQGLKLVAAIHDIVATDAGAIALVWHHVKEGPPAYDARPEHVVRDGKVYVLRDNWAMERGFMKLDGRQYYDQVTAVGEEIFCRCFAEYLYALRDLPAGMVTAAGKAELERVRAIIRSA